MALKDGKEVTEETTEETTDTEETETDTEKEQGPEDLFEMFDENTDFNPTVESTEDEDGIRYEATHEDGDDETEDEDKDKETTKETISEEKTTEETKTTEEPEETDQADEAVAALQAEMAELKTQNERLVQMALDSKKPIEEKPVEKTEDVKPEEPRFALTIPDTMISAVMSQEADQVKAALQALINGTAEIVRKQVLEEMSEHTKGALAQNNAALQASATEQGKTRGAIDDFFNEYPGYQDGDMPLLVQAAMQSVLQSEHHDSWSPLLRDKIAKKVLAISGKDGKVASAKPPGKAVPEKTEAAKKGGKKAPAKRKGPPRSVRSGARPSALSPTGKTIADDIQGLVDGAGL